MNDVLPVKDQCHAAWLYYMFPDRLARDGDGRPVTSRNEKGAVLLHFHGRAECQAELDELVRGRPVRDVNELFSAHEYVGRVIRLAKKPTM
jgi:hypothetical protein